MLQKIGAVLLLSLLAGDGVAGQKVVLLALTKDKAIVSVDGHRRLIILNKTSPEGLTLLEANSQHATIRIHDKTQVLKLGSGVSLYDSENNTQKFEVVINKDRQGMFATQAEINGSYTVNAVIDTGAVAVAMNKKMAQSLNLTLGTGQQQSVETAGGRVSAEELSLNSIKVGSIELRDVKALVVNSDSMDNYILLGMTFLGRLKMTHNPNHLVLETTK